MRADDGGMRILTGGVLAAFVIVLVTPGLAQASSGYNEQGSAFDSSPDKSATVTCPAGTKAIGSGGWIHLGNGGVALTGIVPSPDLTSVTAYGRARASHSGAWSVKAIALCDDGLDPERASGGGLGTATATCPASKILYSTGYRVISPAGEQYVDEVVPSAGLTNVQAHASGGAFVVAFGICALPMNNFARTRAPVDPGADATAGKPVVAVDFGSWVFGAGVKATGWMVDGLGPNSTLDGGRARAWPVEPGLPTKGARVAALDFGDGGMDVYGLCIGSWY
jgi:hypothetical protein